MGEDEMAGGSGLLGGLTGELAQAMTVDASQLVAEPRPVRSFLEPAQGPSRPVVLDGPVSAAVSPSAPAMVFATALLEAAGHRPEPSTANPAVWTLTNESGRVVLRDGDRVVLGRNAMAGVDLVVADKLVSKVHCEVAVAHGVPVLTDRKSTNGTVVLRGGQPIACNVSVALESGDHISVLGEVVLAVVARGSS
jgi:hypothetical protein